MKFINCTPHAICLNNGTVYQPSGILPRVSQVISKFDDNLIATQSFGDVQGLPDVQDGVILIVSAMVLSASDRKDLVAPATNHADTKRNDKGHIISVPGFLRNA